MQQEILAPTPLLNSDGTLSQPGWARQPHWQYQRQAIRAPRWRIKEWDYYAVLCADQQLGITLTVADLGYAGLFALCFLDFANRSFTQVDSLTLLPLGKLGLSADNHQGRIRHQSAALSIDIDLQPGCRQLRFAAPGLTCADGRRGLAGDILLQQPATLESMNIATSWAENRRAFYYNSKINCMPASGGFSLGGQQHSFDPQRDSATRLGEYVHAFHKDTLAATADVPSLERFATSLGFVFQKVPGKQFDENPEDYTLEHSASLAVLDPDGKLAGLIRPPFNAQAIARDLQTLTEKTAP